MVDTCRRRLRRYAFGFRSITFEEMHQFHLKFTEGLSINK